MNDPVYHELLELSWRRKLTAEEQARLQAWLADHPHDKQDWESQAALNQLLEKLPPAHPVSSNFTALVLQAVARESRTRPSRWIFGRISWQSFGWVPRAAAAGLVLGFSLLTYQHHLESNRRAMANSVVQVSELYQVVVSDPQSIEDYDAIRLMGDMQPKADTELLALMQ